MIIKSEEKLLYENRLGYSCSSIQCKYNQVLIEQTPVGSGYSSKYDIIFMNHASICCKPECTAKCYCENEDPKCKCLW